MFLPFCSWHSNNSTGDIRQTWCCTLWCLSLSLCSSHLCVRVAVFSCVLPLCCDIVAGKYVMWGVGVRFCVCLYLCVCMCVYTLARTGERGTVTTEMDVLASSEGSQLVWVRKLVLASARSGGSLHLCSLGAQLEGVGEVWGFFPPTRQVLKGTHPLPPHNPTGLYTGSKNL